MACNASLLMGAHWTPVDCDSAGSALTLPALQPMLSKNQKDLNGRIKQVERTAAMRFGFDGDGLQTAVVAVASALPAAAHPCR